MRRNGWAILAAAFVVCAASYLMVGVTPAAADNSYWGANYFPNVPLITQDGKTIHFYDDMLKGKIVLINFIYTECGETCPLETAKLAQVYKLLGDRMGKDIYFYSITVDFTCILFYSITVEINAFSLCHYSWEFAIRVEFAMCILP